MTLILRFMQEADIKQVSAIDRLSFDPAWPPNSYKFEINQSTISYMAVLEEETSQAGEAQSENGIRRWINNLWGRDEIATSTKSIIGYSGMWKIAEEAHISTIAIHPDSRGRNGGEILLAGMYRKALALDAEYIVLEVRVSNIVAQNLYRKYGFTVEAVKRNYYRSDNEDAYDMRVVFRADTTPDFYDLYDQLRKKQPFIDDYSDSSHPRLG